MNRTRLRAIAGLVALPLAFLLADLLLRLRASNNAAPGTWGPIDVAIYGLGFFWAACTWGIVATLLARLGDRARRPLVVTLGAAAAVAFVSSFGYRLYYYQSPSWQLIKFLLSEPRNAAHIFLWNLTAAHLVGIVFFALLTAGALGLSTTSLRRIEPLQGRARWVVASLFGAVYLTCSALTLATPGFQDPLPVEANTAASVVQYLLAKTAHNMHLVAPVRPAIPPPPEAHRPNVLLLLQESLRADELLPDLGYSPRLDARSLAPYSSAIPGRGAEGFVVFPRARCNATATESSLPTILSGVDLGGDTDAYGRAQTLWSLGKATGARTFLFSAQSYAWSHFDEYFFDRNLDIARTGLDLAPEYANDVGVDDAIPVDAGLAHIASLKGQRWVGVIHLNATHVPGFPGPGITPDEDETKRGLQAVRYIDKQVQRVYEGLEKLGVLADTVVLTTADHGEPLDSPRHVRRLGSYYEETVRVPFWITLPPKVSELHPSWRPNLDAWAKRNVQNIDVLPTIRDLLSLPATSPLDRTQLHGRSLVSAPGNEPDLVSGQSTCAFRTWSQEGLFLVNGTTKVLLSNERSTPEVYDLAADPSEQHNLWGTPAAEAALPWARAHIESGYERRAACERAGAVCILRPPGR
jgi:glucan phosphoethanolaminetransferase (alkaline phosphatase superfamily)